jgi:hypothetical protein
MSPWNLKNETTQITSFMHPLLGFKNGRGSAGDDKEGNLKIGTKEEEGIVIKITGEEKQLRSKDQNEMFVNIAQSNLSNQSYSSAILI